MKMKTTFVCTIMRGGTSKGIFLMEEDLPRDPFLRDRIILAIFGSPDIRQIDGLGGADSLTSKLALIQVSPKRDRDIDYTFGAVGIDKAFVDYSANCGNISSAVGPFAIDRGLVKATEPISTVRILNTNTRKMIEAKFPVKRGRVISEGDYPIAGVPGTGAKIELSFVDPGGAVTGKLIPAGESISEIAIDTGEKFPITIIDAGNPTAFIRAEDLGLKGTELPENLDQDARMKKRLEAIREKAGDLMGIPPSPSIPKIVFVARPQDFRTIQGERIGREEINFAARVMAMGKLHKSFAITAAVAAGGAALIPGSIVNEMVEGCAGEMLADGTVRKKLCIGHPAGKFEVVVEGRVEGGSPHILRCTIGRTARKIMEGRVFISRDVYGNVDDKKRKE